MGYEFRVSPCSRNAFGRTVELDAKWVGGKDVPPKILVLERMGVSNNGEESYVYMRMD